MLPDPRRRPALLTGVAFLFGLAACGDDTFEATPLGQDEIPTGPIRLADVLADADIDSPLLDIEAAANLADLGDVPSREVFGRNFEALDLKARWPELKTLEIDEDETGNKSLLMRRHPAGQRRVGWIVAKVEPGTHYAFSRRIRANAKPDADFAVIETKVHPSFLLAKPKRLDYQSQGAAVRLHWPAPVEADGEWHTSSVSFFTTQRTTHLAIVLRPTPEYHEYLLQWGPRPDDGTDRRVWFDDLTLDVVEPTPEQMMALVKGRSPAPGADPELGIAKRGQFPPLGQPFSTHSREHDNFSFRYALYAPPQTEMVFPVPVHPDATLYFSVALSRETRRGDAATFEVAVRGVGEEKVIWSRSLAARPGEWLWYDERLPLSEWGGKRIQLVLRTRALNGSPHPVWGNPVVDFPPPRGEVRNVILIAVDTLRADRMSCYGYRRRTTPRLEALCKDGVRFENVCSNSTWTCPSFASIFTGVVPSRHRVWAYAPVAPLPARFSTLAERYRSRGWCTNAIIYKAPLYNGGYDQGFDVSFNVPRGKVRAEENLAEAMEWLELNAQRRNFLFLHFDDPHQPFTQPAPYDRKFGPPPSSMGFRLPMSFHEYQAKDEKEREFARSLYDGEVAYVDEQIGRFFDALKERDLYDDAVIIFVADHGEAMWEHKVFGHGGSRLHDTVVRVPLIVKPGAASGFARATTVTTQVRGFDAMPTLLELSGLPVEDGLDAETLVPLLQPDAGDAPDRVAVAEIRIGACAVRNRGFKYIRWGNGGESLFDLEKDPLEQKNVAGRHPAEVAKMRLQLAEYLLLRRTGQFVLSLTGDPAEEADLALRGVTSTLWFFGAQPVQQSKDRVRIQGRPIGPIATLVELQTEGEVSVGEDGQPSTFTAVEFKRYVEGDLARLIAAGDRGPHFFTGPPPIEADADEITGMTPEQLEALKRLGYTGNAPGGHDRDTGKDH